MRKSVEGFQDGSIGNAHMAEYMGGGSDLLREVTEALAGKGYMDPYIHRTLCSLDDYCLSVYPGSPLTQEIVDRWSLPMEGETRKLYNKRMMYKDRINGELSRYGLSIAESSTPGPKPRTALPDQ